MNVEKTEKTIKVARETSYTTVNEYLERKTCAVGSCFTWNAVTGASERHLVFCKKRSCPACQKQWAMRHLARLQEFENNRKYFHDDFTLFHVVLTTAANVPPKQVWDCFRYFWQKMRLNYGKPPVRAGGSYGVEYVITVEQNRKATQPHFHVLLYLRGKWDKLPKEDIEELWEEAQAMAKFEKIAWNVFTHKLEDKNGGFYLFKYLSKEGDKSYEIPQKDVWAGRHIRYSRNFFPVQTKVIDSFWLHQKKLENPDENSYIDFELLPNVSAAFAGAFSTMERGKICVETVTRDWSFYQDRVKTGVAGNIGEGLNLTPLDKKINTDIMPIGINTITVRGLTLWQFTE